MIKVELTCDQIDLDKIFDLYFQKAKDSFAQSDNPAAALMARVPDAMARRIWQGLTQEQKEKIAAGILEAKGRELTDPVRQKLAEMGIDLTVTDVTVRAE